MSPIDLFDEIIQSINPEEVPLEFIVMAKVRDFNGNERIIRGSELSQVLRGPAREKYNDARIVLHVRKIRDAIAAGVNEIYDEINRRIADEFRAQVIEDKNKDI